MNKINILKKIGKTLNSLDITWALSSSLVLKKYNLADDFNDIDIMVLKKDLPQLDKALLNLGDVLSKSDNKIEGIYHTKHFYRYNVEGIDVEVMADLDIQNDNGIYKPEFSLNKIENFMLIDNLKLPLVALEQWFIFYYLIPQKKYKAKLIKEYFKKNKSKRKDLLKEALTKEIPDELKKEINDIIKNY
ncbi:MAG: hypothetical protein N4A54_11530 [Peptostreptococcaceae bacterium]|jgi:hypothetical protein|nr:hypothetical protein [Peptostreptococcaceae bacterium]